MQRRALETQKRILESAVRLFALHGPNGVTVDEIAGDAQINKQRIYAYFTSKEKLFSAALLHVFENAELFSKETLKEAEAHPEKLTECVVRGFLTIHRTSPSLWRLLAWANLEGRECVSVLQSVRKEDNAFLRRIFERATVAGLVRQVSFEVWLFSLLAITCFRFSNCLTLAHTLGWDPAAKSFEKELVAELDRIFSVRG